MDFGSSSQDDERTQSHPNGDKAAVRMGRPKRRYTSHSCRKKRVMNGAHENHTSSKARCGEPGEARMGAVEVESEWMA